MSLLSLKAILSIILDGIAASSRQIMLVFDDFSWSWSMPILCHNFLQKNINMSSFVTLRIMSNSVMHSIVYQNPVGKPSIPIKKKIVKKLYVWTINMMKAKISSNWDSYYPSLVRIKYLITRSSPYLRIVSLRNAALFSLCFLRLISSSSLLIASSQILSLDVSVGKLLNEIRTSGWTPFSF
jgi:hypothetical protein